LLFLAEAAGGPLDLTCLVVRYDVDVVRVLDDPIVQLPEGFAAHNSGIVDQYVHWTDFLGHLIGPLVDLLPIRDINHITLAVVITMFGQQIHCCLDGCVENYCHILLS